MPPRSRPHPPPMAKGDALPAGSKPISAFHRSALGCRSLRTSPSAIRNPQLRPLGRNIPALIPPVSAKSRIQSGKGRRGPSWLSVRKRSRKRVRSTRTRVMIRSPTSTSGARGARIRSTVIPSEALSSSCAPSGATSANANANAQRRSPTPRECAAISASDSPCTSASDATSTYRRSSARRFATGGARLMRK